MFWPGNTPDLVIGLYPLASAFCLFFSRRDDDVMKSDRHAFNLPFG
jgi:hypothetical protein